MAIAFLITGHLPDAAWLGAVYGASEIFLGITRRSKSGSTSHDRRSLLLLWSVILLCIWLSLWIASNHPESALPHARVCYLLGLTLFVAGIVLRWYSIFYLGRFFTVDVAIAQEHELIDSGPYRYIRHPSYTGALLVFMGFGLCLANWAALICLILPIAIAFIWRIHVEERALSDALGDQYRAYILRTKRLIPFVY